MIDSELIKTFRDQVNQNGNFIRQEYGNRNGKNHWNVICSCMDWITVAIEYIENHEMDNENINVKCMQAYTYISAIDIVFESISQLHRVIINDNNISFKNENNIFSTKQSQKDDNDYFKHIRAIFGAHPVNLKNNEDEKWYASWPTDHVYNGFDFAVILYSLDAEQDDITFGYQFEELNKFLKSRYNYLETLSLEIDEQYKKFKDKKINQNIDVSNDHLRQLKILKDESKKRLNKEYYNYTIEELIILFEAYNELENKTEIITNYINDLKKLVDEIYCNLQNMIFKDLEYDNLLNPEFPKEIHYELSKIHECLIDNKFDPMFSYYFEKIKDYLENTIEINASYDYKKLFLYISAGIYHIDKNKK